MDINRIPSILLQTFLTVAEASQISEAARRLHLSQPTATGHIPRLEASLETTLFIRSASGVSLTERGAPIFGSLFMKLINGSLAGLVLAGILAIVPAAAFAHGGGGGGGGGHGGGGGGHGFGGGRGGHAFVGGNGHTFGGLTGRGFSPVFSGMRVSPSGRFSGRGDDGRFRDGDFGRHGNSRDNDERHHRHFFSDFDFVAFGFPYWWYPDYGYPDYGYSDEEAMARLTE